MDRFVERFLWIANKAFGNAADSAPTGRLGDMRFVDQTHQAEFISACHRGYERAQDELVKSLVDIDADAGLDDLKKLYRKLLLRKIADFIAMTMINHQHHVMRRFSIHQHVPSLDMNIVKTASWHAKKFNSESRKTFALLADLTTFIHVADILRVDFRKSSRKFELIELKSGHVNKTLLPELDKYSPEPNSIRAIESDPTIARSHLAQAKRMLRQRIRIAQIDEILRTDEGIDPGLNINIRLSKKEHLSEPYLPFLNELSQIAINEKAAGGTVDSCLHIGIGFAPDQKSAFGHALHALAQAKFQHYIENGRELQTIMDEFSTLAPSTKSFKPINLLRTNLISVPCPPDLIFGFKYEYLPFLISEELCILADLDIIGFADLARHSGLDIRLSTRKETEKVRQELGSHNVPAWDNRAIEVGSGENAFTLLSGMIARILTYTQSPSQIVRLMLETSRELQGEKPGEINKGSGD